jgi:hypothetical protein
MIDVFPKFVCKTVKVYILFGYAVYSVVTNILDKHPAYLLRAIVSRVQMWYVSYVDCKECLEDRTYFDLYCYTSSAAFPLVQSKFCVLATIHMP